MGRIERKKAAVLTRKMALGLMPQADGALSSPGAYIDALNTAGLEAKGQLSGTYAMAGVSGAVAAGIDPLAAVAPLAHAKVSGQAGGSHMACAFMTLQRMPEKHWGEARTGLPAPHEAPVPLPEWTAATPLCLSYLRGRASAAELQVKAGVWLGFGNPEDVDETGLSVGAFAEGALSGSTIVLRCDAPLHFGRFVLSDGLRDALEDLLEENIKRKVAFWLLAVGGEPEFAEANGAPVRRAGLAMRLARDLGEKAGGTLPDVIDAAIDTFVEGDAASNAAGNANANLTGLAALAAGIAAKVKKAVTSDALTTDDLLKHLKKMREEIEKQRSLFAQIGTSPLAVNARPGSRAERTGVGFRRGEVESLADKRLAEIDELEKRLIARQKGKAAGAPDRVTQMFGKMTKKRAKAGGQLTMATFLAAGSTDFKAKATFAAADQVLEAENPSLQAFVAAGAKAYRKLHRIGHQSIVPGKMHGREARTLVVTTETSITHSLYSAAASAGARAGKRGAAVERGISSWVTMTYDSVQVGWFDDLQPGNHEVAGNRGGVSFGMSVLRDRLLDYRHACAVAESEALTGPARYTEAAMTRHLRVTATELRAFIRNIPYEILAVDDSVDTAGESDAYLVESAFALLTPQKLTVTDHVATGLGKLAPVATLRKTGVRGTDAGLQSIRLRYRITHMDERRRTILKLGTSIKPLATEEDDPLDPDANEVKQLATSFFGIPDELPENTSVAAAIREALPLSLGLSAEWVSRVGMEGIVEIDTWLADGMSDEKAEFAPGVTHDEWMREFIVPPVALFAQ